MSTGHLSLISDMAKYKSGKDQKTCGPLGLYVALQSTGILELSFNPGKPADQSLTIDGVNTDAGFMPGWLSLYGDHVYSISRMGYPDTKAGSGGLFGFRVKSTTRSAPSDLKSTLLSLDTTSSNGKGGVHCEVSPDGKILAAANITASTVSIYQLSDTGLIGKALHVLDYSKTTHGRKNDHPHQVAFDPSGRFLVVPLRTGDRIDVFSVKYLPRLPLVESVKVPAPAGPRHVAFSKIKSPDTYMYLTSEKDNTIRVYQTKTEAKQLSLRLLQTTSTIAGGIPATPDEHKTLAAEIAVSNDGRHVYVSNRSVSLTEPDTITTYSVDQSSSDAHHLRFVGTQSIQGKHPRMFALSNDKQNMWIAVANQWTQDVLVYERDLDRGLLQKLRGRLSVRVEADLGRGSGEIHFAEDKGEGAELTLDERKRAMTKGPMCVVWKPQGSSMTVRSVL